MDDYDFDEDEDRFDGDEGDSSFDEDDIEDEDYDDDLDDASDNSDKPKVSDADVEIDAFIDGEMNARYAGDVPYGDYGISHSEDDLTKEQKDLYEDNYLAGWESQDDLNDEDDNI